MFFMFKLALYRSFFDISLYSWFRISIASFIDIFSFITLSIISASLEICSSCFWVLCVISIIRVYSPFELFSSCFSSSNIFVMFP